MTNATVPENLSAAPQFGAQGGYSTPGAPAGAGRKGPREVLAMYQRAGSSVPIGYNPAQGKLAYIRRLNGQ
jgi:hypothetical protein